MQHFSFGFVVVLMHFEYVLMPFGVNRVTLESNFSTNILIRSIRKLKCSMHVNEKNQLCLQHKLKFFRKHKEKIDHALTKKALKII